MTLFVLRLAEGFHAVHRGMKSPSLVRDVPVSVSPFPETHRLLEDGSSFDVSNTFVFQGFLWSLLPLCLFGRCCIALCPFAVDTGRIPEKCCYRGPHCLSDNVSRDDRGHHSLESICDLRMKLIPAISVNDTFAIGTGTPPPTLRGFACRQAVRSIDSYGVRVCTEVTNRAITEAIRLKQNRAAQLFLHILRIRFFDKLHRMGTRLSPSPSFPLALDEFFLREHVKIDSH